jgi:hypothetical protein
LGAAPTLAKAGCVGACVYSGSRSIYLNSQLRMLECFFCSEAWLVKMDAQMKVIRPIFAKTYGEGEVTKWIANWRTFFIAVAEMFAFRNGEEWGVGHYLFKKK